MYAIRSYYERYQADYHLTKIGVFGSIARGEQTDQSDIDLLIEFEPNTEDIHTIKYKLKTEIYNVFHTTVDICRLKYIKPVFRAIIESEVKYV